MLRYEDKAASSSLTRERRYRMEATSLVSVPSDLPISERTGG